ncbi:MAG: D-cysteine desulfhydrase family protein [Desulforhabdus sp.]|jgi:D-cysteine desulfhydrase|nr:D-cysteine desulfhydrase family protein [Desulforhabdus sp.]
MEKLLEKRIKLAHLPTPIQFLPRISESLGVELFIKRDDLTESVASGNKIRKLEYLINDAQKKGADALITCGGVQSNHCRAVAYSAARLGMPCLLLLRGEKPDLLQGNLLVNYLLGAECRFFSAEAFRRLAGLEQEARADLQRQSKSPYVIPMGGSNGIGSLGYVRMMKEIAEAEFSADHIYCALGSGGTLAGILAGKQHFNLACKVHGIAVCDDAVHFIKETMRIRQELLDWFGIELDLEHLADQIDDNYIGTGYALNTQNEWRELIRIARMEGLVLDPVYTLKAFLGMMDHCHKGIIGRGERVLFVHTGGHYGLFPKRDELIPLM